MDDTEKSLGKLLPPEGVTKNNYIKVNFGAFGYSGDIVHLDKTIDQVLRLREEVNLDEPEETEKLYG